jgi:sn-glycerol 3-phosphate transport system permease protein
MVERRPLLTATTHAVLGLGLLVVAFPLYVTLVASTHDAATLLGRIPLWFGDHLAENYGRVLAAGGRGAGSAPVGRMLLNSFIMSAMVAGGKIAISILSAYAIVYFRFPLRMACFWTIFLTLMLPV